MKDGEICKIALGLFAAKALTKGHLIGPFVSKLSVVEDKNLQLLTKYDAQYVIDCNHPSYLIDKDERAKDITMRFDCNQAATRMHSHLSLNRNEQSGNALQTQGYVYVNTTPNDACYASMANQAEGLYIPAYNRKTTIADNNATLVICGDPKDVPAIGTRDSNSHQILAYLYVTRPIPAFAEILWSYNEENLLEAEIPKVLYQPGLHNYHKVVADVEANAMINQNDDSFAWSEISDADMLLAEVQQLNLTDNVNQDEHKEDLEQDVPSLVSDDPSTPSDTDSDSHSGPIASNWPSGTRIEIDFRNLNIHTNMTETPAEPDQVKDETDSDTDITESPNPIQLPQRSYHTPFSTTKPK